MRVQSIYQDRYIADSLQVKAKPMLFLRIPGSSASASPARRPPRAHPYPRPLPAIVLLRVWRHGMRLRSIRDSGYSRVL